jgi:serine/threonine protein kinase
MTKPSDTILRDYKLGRLTPDAMAQVERWLKEPGAADELSRVTARDRVTDALAGITAVPTAAAAVGPVADLPPVIDGCRVIRELGRGGMGIVVEAEDPVLCRRVAIKVITPQFAADGGARDRFLREAQAVARIEHQNVIPVYRVSECGGLPFLVMPKLEGRPMDGWLKEWQEQDKLPPVSEIRRVCGAIAAGLAAAHAAGLIHRDIKPGNVWLEADGGVKLLDFGLAKPLDPTDAASLTHTGGILGTPAYMSPEQARGAEVDHRTDLWSLGVILYQSATGERPFDGKSTYEVLTKLATDTPQSPVTLVDGVPPELSDLIDQLLCKDPDGRPATAAEVRDRLLPPVGPPLLPPPPPPPKKKPQPRRGVWVAAAALASVVLAVVVALVIVNSKDAARSGAANDKGNAEPPKPTLRPIPSPKPAPDPDRAAAEAVLASGGRILLNGSPGPYFTGPLPKEPFRLTAAHWHKDRRVTDADVAALKGCKHVTSVMLTETSVTDAGMAAFKGWTGLTALNTQGTFITDAGHENFKDCTRLENLNIQTLYGHPRMTDSGAAHYRNCKKLVTLNLSFNDVTDRGVSYFRDCAALEHLSLCGCERVGDRTLELLAGFPRLRFLTLQDTRVTDAGADLLPACTNLTDLNLIGTRVTEAKATELAKRMPWCRILWGQRAFEPAAPDRRAAHWALDSGGTVRANGEARDIKAVADLPPGDLRLTHIDLKGRGITEELMASFRNCEGVTHLDLSFTDTDAAALAHFHRCADLTVLLLEKCPKVTDEAMPQMKGHPKLARLVLLDTGITDAGAEHLKECKSLRELWVNAPKVSSGKVLGLHKALPKCLIVGGGSRYEPTER